MILNQLINLLKELLVEHEIDPMSITKQTHLYQELGFDSINLLMVGIMIESHFKIKIETKDFASFQTVGDITDYIEKKQQ